MLLPTRLQIYAPDPTLGLGDKGCQQLSALVSQQASIANEAYQ